ncbi:precorrin-6y C5,15-methyltransferase (decarboxylating) subunit CbiE [Maridesulfovibrio ferrireducens]|uniref:precorrin-6y C5,15-methyltransferase (decarboxylating) subunit CbiE n=1 Tax=Maridesulfovibrio ferrireducens TaxID=246191 RepID=UPI001A2B5093|nr:precorrin-6y C5,15-methyltransferase (decarboxylating) subunit CbiE [Maridesulfovibrio ferrireducens]MBI9112112.1 precorrin-6y C5,15-methyltransferase (decarboxylating) subunit CbiE [Maridesulfovibrio ferrireducens]
MKHVVQIIGLHPGSLEPMESSRKIIEEADVLAGGKRLLNEFPDFKGELLPFFSPVAAFAEKLEERRQSGKRIVLLADGDPLLFGIAESMIRHLGNNNVCVTPCTSTVQLGASRLGKTWKNIDIISLHGRTNFSPLFGSLQRKADCAVYTDSINSPSVIARALLEKCVHGYTMTVLAELGTDSETITTGPLENFINFTCPDLNIVMLTVESTFNEHPVIGRNDEDFTRQKELITKLPVRAAGIALLGLNKGQTIWDLGAGCGSVSIEASFLAENSQVFAVEKDTARFEMIKENIRKFRAFTVEPIQGTMPEALANLPEPDRIFIGGGIGKDSATISEATARLKPGGRIVVHAILMGSVQRTKEIFENLGWQWQAMLLQASVSDKLAGDIRFKAQNPVTIMWADKPEA